MGLIEGVNEWCDMPGGIFYLLLHFYIVDGLGYVLFLGAFWGGFNFASEVLGGWVWTNIQMDGGWILFLSFSLFQHILLFFIRFLADGGW